MFQHWCFQSWFQWSVAAQVVNTAVVVILRSVVPVVVPVVSGSSNGVVLQAQLFAATAVRTTLPAAPSRRTAATTTPV